MKQGSYNTERKPTPKVDALEELLEIFTPAQITRIAAVCRSMMKDGWGDVTIRFNGGHPRFIIRNTSEELPRE